MSKKIVQFILSVVTVIAFCGHGLAQADFQKVPTPWADSIIQKLSLDEQLGQLFMVPAWTDPKHQYFNQKEVENWILNHGVGGIIFFQGGPDNQLKRTLQFQSISKIPLLIGMDAEWGLSMRLDSTILYPRQMTLGAIADVNQIEKFAEESARQLKRMGVHFSFSPVVDINNNPKNPVISNRSFGEDRERVLHYSMAFMNGLQKNRILACAKHFPGHGDTNTDSHEAMPLIPFSKERLDSLELYPYRPLIQNGLGGVMTGHLQVPAYESNSKIPASLSHSLVTDLLQKELGFQGLIITDALNMQGVAKNFKPGEMEALAVQAGNDILLFPSSIPKAIEAIKRAMERGEISAEQIRAHCYKVLQAKEWCGLATGVYPTRANLMSDLHDEKALQMNQDLITSSLTLLQNDRKGLELWNDLKRKKALVVIGGDSTYNVVNAMQEYADMSVMYWPKEVDSTWKDTLDVLLSLLNGYQDVAFAWVNTSSKAVKNFGVSSYLLDRISNWNSDKNVLVLMFANPYALMGNASVHRNDVVAVAYQDDPLTERMMVEALFRARPFFGQLPVSIDETWKSGWGICIAGGHRISRGVLSSPESLNWIKSRNVPNQLTRVYTENYFGESEFAKSSLFHFNWNKVDSIANKGVADGAYPGCRVLVVHKGEIVYDRAYGFLDANKTEPVQLNSVYDLASITKLAGSGLAMMKMMDEHEWSPSGYLGDDLSFPRKSPYAKIKWKDMLAHQAGLKNFIPFHSTLSSNHWLSKIPTEYGVQVADSMYTDTILYGKMRDLILKTPLTIPAKYEYSDLGYYFVKEWVEKKTQSTYDIWLSDQFYTPLALRSMGYLPLNRMSKSRIAPTENDSLFRHQILRGYVHDQGAALMGGVAGHAGLFSNAYDLAVVMQMLMNQGSYGEKQWIKASTVQYFNQRHFPGNRRGLILDKPTLDKVGGSPSSLASHESFGHTGFTGTMCWADPEEELIFVFLSNRIHPSVDNKKLIQQNIRTQLHTEVYKEILLRKDQAK